MRKPELTARMMPMTLKIGGCSLAACAEAEAETDAVMDATEEDIARMDQLLELRALYAS